MRKCSVCHADINDGLTSCPYCGTDLADMAAEETNAQPIDQETAVNEAAPEETAAEMPVPEEKPAAAEVKKASPVKIAVAVALIVTLVALLAALIMVGIQTTAEAEPEQAPSETMEEVVAETIADGEAGTAREKGSYTASDEEVIANKDVVVAKMGDKTLTNGQLQVYFWMSYHNFMTSNYSYAQYFGLDMSRPLDVQVMNAALHGEDATMTWQQYFLQFALDSWHQVQAVAAEAEKAGLEMAAEDQQKLDTLEDTIKEAIAEYDVSLEEYLAMNFGAAAGVEEYRHYQEVYYRGAPYYVEETAKNMPTDEDLEAYFADHEDEYASGGITKDTKLVDVRHILIQPENAQEDGTFSDEEWEACRKRAQSLLEEFRRGDRSEESFAAMAGEHSQDPGSVENGGLYEDVYVGQMVKPFEDWCFDPARAEGDNGLVKTDYGYHIMYFVEAAEEVWKEYVQNDWLNEKSGALLETVMAENPTEIFYDKILIGNLTEQQ